MTEPTTAAGRRYWRMYADGEDAEDVETFDPLTMILAIEAEARAAALDEARAAAQAERDKASASGKWTRHGLMMALAAIDALREGRS